LQVWAQTVIGASSAAVILAAEPAFGVATGWVVLGERLDKAGWLGAVLIMVAIFMVITNQRDVPSKEAEAVTPGY
jgi:drug/metabolite transporter (DMT)-like permease